MCPVAPAPRSRTPRPSRRPTTDLTAIYYKNNVYTQTLMFISLTRRGIPFIAPIKGREKTMMKGTVEGATILLGKKM